MRQQFLSDPDDLKWLYDVHVKKAIYDNNRWLKCPWDHVKSAILHGNEDAPHKVELFYNEHPYHDEEPIDVLDLYPDEDED